MKTSIIILSFNNVHLIQKCLESIRQNTDLSDAEVIVVDNNSDQKTVDYLKKEKGIITVFNKSNAGFSKGNNQGAKLAKGEYLIFLNNDTEVKPNWLEPLLRDFDLGKVGAVGPKLLYPNGSIQHAGIVFAHDRIPRHLHIGKKDSVATSKKREFQALTGACLVIPRKLFNEIGGFDTEYRNGLEDIDLCLRIGKAGYKLMYEPESVVIHYESASKDRLKHALTNTDLYMSRWRDVRPDANRYYREDGVSWPAIFYNDIVKMAYYNDRYGTTPKHVQYLRLFYILPHKILTLVRLIITLDFKAIVARLKGENPNGNG